MLFLCGVAGMKIVVVETVWHAGSRYAPFERWYLTAFGIYPSLHARQIASVVASQGHEVVVASERFGSIPYDEQWDLVIVHATLSATPHGVEIAKHFKSRGNRVVFAGYLGNVYPDEMLSHVDGVLQGRGELEIVDCLLDVESDSLKKVYSARPYDGSVCLPALKLNSQGFSLVAPVEATRGCPHRCDFCMECGMSKKALYFKRPIEDVVSEISALPEKFVMFYDESLTIDTSYAFELFEALKPLKKHFFCNGNVDVLGSDSELVKKSREAGCISWLVGFESFSAESLSEVGKSSNSLELYEQAVETIHKYDMSVIGSFMFGFDGECKDVFSSTLQGIDALGIDAADFNVLTPIPGTPLFDRLEKQNRILSRDWTKYSMHEAVFEPHLMSCEQLKSGVDWLYQQFYTPSKYIGSSISSLSRGIYPSLLVLARLGIAFSMGMKKK